MRPLALFWLCGCNAIFGLDSTQVRATDAQYFDAPADAPFSCPPAGILPMYSRLLHQVIQQNCWAYTVDSGDGTALASCFDASTQIEAGPVDQPLTPVTITTKYAAGTWYAPAFTPDPNMFISVYDSTTMTSSLALLVRGQDGTWSDGPALTWPWPSTNGDGVTVPSRGVGRHMLYFRQADLGWYELVESAPATWTIARPQVYTAADLGVQYMYEIQMSGDGLRMVAYAMPVGATTYTVVYTSRPSLGADWPPFQPLASVPSGATSPFITDDCARVYFSGLSSVLYVQQQ